jgi:hypothetical protein
MDLRRALATLTAKLRERSIDHALIGGLAMAAHGVVRETQDLDLLVDGASTEAVHEVMAELGYRAFGLKVQASSNNPRRRRLDMADMQARMGIFRL